MSRRWQERRSRTDGVSRLLSAETVLEWKETESAVVPFGFSIEAGEDLWKIAGSR